MIRRVVQELSSGDIDILTSTVAPTKDDNYINRWCGCRGNPSQGPGTSTPNPGAPHAKAREMMRQRTSPTPLHKHGRRRTRHNHSDCHQAMATQKRKTTILPAKTRRNTYDWMEDTQPYGPYRTPGEWRLKRWKKRQSERRERRSRRGGG